MSHRSRFAAGVRGARLIHQHVHVSDSINEALTGFLVTNERSKLEMKHLATVQTAGQVSSIFLLAVATLPSRSVAVRVNTNDDPQASLINFVTSTSVPSSRKLPSLDQTKAEPLRAPSSKSVALPC